MIPTSFKNLNYFLNGLSYHGRVQEVTPPKVEIKTEEDRSGGLDTPVEHDMGTNVLIGEFSASHYDAEIAKTFGKPGQTHVFKGTYVDLSKAENNVTITMTGMTKAIDPGSWKSGSNAPCKATTTCVYYKLEINGAVIHEIDALNMVRIIDGVDQLAAQRAALGI
ncbi:MAG: phage major tail tube protein [Verrucomicrobiota bacterium]|nr:phage major tail tube protein [Verrucomicrobiota bacterium]